MSRLALKFLTDQNTGPFSGYEWPMCNGKPGKWVGTKGKLVVCENGVHACTLLAQHSGPHRSGVLGKDWR